MPRSCLFHCVHRPNELLPPIFVAPAFTKQWCSFHPYDSKTKATAAAIIVHAIPHQLPRTLGKYHNVWMLLWFAKNILPCSSASVILKWWDWSVSWRTALLKLHGFKMMLPCTIPASSLPQPPSFSFPSTFSLLSLFWYRICHESLTSIKHTAILLSETPEC